MSKEQMTMRRTWEDFRAAGLLWWINRFLHLFGWAIAVEIDDQGTTTDAYPVTCRFRGFDEKSETDGFRDLTHHLADELPVLLRDVREPDPPPPPPAPLPTSCPSD